jgi:hypothetical protein
MRFRGFSLTNRLKKRFEIFDLGIAPFSLMAKGLGDEGKSV